MNQRAIFWFILHPSSFILHPSSFILHPSSFILHPSSFILHPSSFILHPSSFILHPSSFILHPSSGSTGTGAVSGRIGPCQRFDSPRLRTRLAGRCCAGRPGHLLIWFSDFLRHRDF